MNPSEKVCGTVLEMGILVDGRCPLLMGEECYAPVPRYLDRFCFLPFCYLTSKHNA